MPDRPNPYTYSDTIAYAAECIIEAGRDALQQCDLDFPDRAYVAYGQPVHDCQQFTVSLLQAYVGTPGDQAVGPQACDGPASAVFSVQLVRCTPRVDMKTKRVLSPEEQTEASLGYYRDAAALLRIADFMPMQYDRATIADVSIGEPQGQFIPIILNLVVGLA